MTTYVANLVPSDGNNYLPKANMPKVAGLVASDGINKVNASSMPVVASLVASDGVNRVSTNNKGPRPASGQLWPRSN